MLYRNLLLIIALFTASQAIAGPIYDYLRVDNIEIDGSNIVSKTTNSDINITPNGTGTVNSTKLNLTTSLRLNGYTVSEISNDTTLTDSSVVALITENAAKVYVDSGLALKQNLLVNSAGLRGALNDETGTALAVFSDSPALSGNPTTPNQTQGDNSTRIANTFYVDTGLATKQNLLVNSAGLRSALTDETGVAGGAVFADSPAFLGNPTAPTQAPGDNSTKIATTGYADTGLALKQNLLVNSAGVATAVSDETGTLLLVFSNSPTFSGDPQAPTQLTADNDNSVATTAFVKAAMAGSTGDVTGPASSADNSLVLFDGLTGKIIKQSTGSGYIKLTIGVPAFSSTIPGTDVANTPAGDIASTTAQAAINEIDTEKASRAGNNTMAGTNNFTGRLTVTTTTNSSQPCPSMTTTQRDALGSPANGDCVNNTTTNSHQRYNGSAWENIGGGITSSQANATVYTFRATTNNGQNCFGNGTFSVVEFEDEVTDTENVYNTGTGAFIPSTNTKACCLSASLQSASSSRAAGEAFGVHLFENGVELAQISRRELDDANSGANSDAMGKGICIPVTPGITYNIRGNASASLNCTATTEENYFTGVCFKNIP
jgi:hypothetical protein